MDNVRVLILDDEAQLRSTLVEFLEREGYELADRTFRRGAFDFFPKPLDDQALGQSLAAARTLIATGG